MTMQPGLAPKTLAALGAMTLGLLFADSKALATTLAYWRFEGGGVATPADGDWITPTAGRTTIETDPDPLTPPAFIPGHDSSGNGNTLYTWDDTGSGHQYRPNVPPNSALRSGLPNNFSIQNNGDFPATFTWSLQSSPTLDIEPVEPLAWTIEASIHQTATSTHQTFVGRDGNGENGGPRGQLYFKTFNGQLQILFTDAAGNDYDLPDPTGNLALNTWYNVAAVSDGTTLSLYKDSGAGYQLVNSMALTPGDTRLNYDDNGSSTVGDTQWGWSIGRGRYGTSDAQGDNHVDRFLGYIDEVRISDTALTPNQFLFEPVFTLIVEVNKTTGQASLKNVGSDPVSFDYYLIESAGNALNPAGWNSLNDQNYDAGLASDFNGSGGVDGADLAQWEGDYGLNGDSDADHNGDSEGDDFLAWQRQYGKTPGAGDSWDEAGGASVSQLAELYLNNATTLDPGESVSLGTAYNTSVFGSANGDLTFQYAVPGAPGLSSGGVVYVTSIEPASAAVPEPTAASMIVLLAAGALAATRRRG